MTPTHKCFSILLLAALLLVAQQPANAVPAYSVQDLRFTYPLPDNTNTYSFLVFSTEGDIPGTDVFVREVRMADGENRPLEAVAVAPATTTVTTKGQKITLTLNPQFFLAPGEYRVTLVFQGPKATPSLATTIVITRLAADINLDELKDQTVALTRPIPFWPASSDFTFNLRENTRRVTLSDLKVVGQGLYQKNTKELSPGAVAAAPVLSNPNGAPVNVPPGQVQPLKVSFWGLSKSGEFDTRLLVTSTSFAGEKAIPIKVTVRDFVLFPLLAIAIGVVGGYFTRRLVAVERPRNENTFNLLRLQNELERFRDLVSKPASSDTINALLAQLKLAREKNELGDFNSVEAELPKIQEKLDEFRKAQLQARQAASTTHKSLESQVKELEKDTLTDGEERELQSIKNRLADAEQLLLVGMVDAAEITLEEVSQSLDDFRVRKLTNYLNLLTIEFINLSLSGDAATTGETLKAEIQGFLKSKTFDHAREKLEAFKLFIETKKAESGQPGASENAAALPAVPRALPEATLVTRIVVTTPINERIAGNTINFTIEDPEHFLEPNDQFRWFFDDGGASDTQATHAPHRFNESGNFQVRVEIRKNGTLVRTLSELVTIAPNAIELARTNVLQDILRNEKILSTIALVLAIISGVLFLYIGKVFGSLVDYLLAILWGFGIDNSVKGFAAVLAKISGPDT